jgi:mitochondrial fission protein ELM1
LWDVVVATASFKSRSGAREKKLPEDQSSDRLLPQPTRCWILTDGKIGDEVQCRGLAAALGVIPIIRHVAPRGIYAWAMPFGPINPRESPHIAGSPLAPPYPDLAIAAGRRSVPYLRALKRLSNGATFTVFLKDPYCSRSFADLIVVPEHDRLRGDNVITALTPANRLSVEKLAAARMKPDARIDHLPRPRVALLVGGPSTHHRYGAKEAAELAAIGGHVAGAGMGLMVTPSRRTPKTVVDGIRAHVPAEAFLWDGTGANPYLAILAHADAIIVTADSVNMVGEAVATGKPIYIYEPAGGHRKISAYLDRLEALGAVRRWRGKFEDWSYAPINATPIIAAEIARRYRQSRARFA